MEAHPLKRLALRAWRSLEAHEHELLYVFFEITRSCNLSCRHCGSDCSAAEQSPTLSLDSWKAIAADLKAHFGTKPIIVITGGEPLCHPELLDIGAYLRDLGFPWGMVSNAYAWTPTTLANLVHAGMVSLTLSLDGPERAHNWLRRNPHSFKSVIGALRDLRSARDPSTGKPLVHYDVVTCVHPGNLAHLDECADILLEEGLPAWRLFRVFPSGRAKESGVLALSAAQTQEMLTWIERKRPQLKQAGLSLSLSCEGWFCPAREARLRNQASFCRSGINFASILADGSICGCNNNHPSFHQGNILKDSFSRLWSSGFVEHRRRPWLRQSLCAKCRHFSDCHGGPLHLWSATRERPEFCYYTDE